MVIYLIFQSSPSATPLFSAWNTGRKGYVKGVSLFKRNSFRCKVMKFIANHQIIERIFWLKSRKLLIFINRLLSKTGFIQEMAPINQGVCKRGVLLKRESSFCSTFEDKNNRYTKENRNFMTIASVKELRYFYAVAWCFAIYREMMIRLFALSTTEVSNEDR